MSLDFSLIDRDILEGVADAIRYVDGTSAGIAPKDFAARVRELKYTKPTWLYFTMPNGGVVTLTKTGSPTDVILEYSLDNGASWIEWIENGNVRTVTLAAGHTVHVRNKSNTSTRFSTSSSNYYKFSFSDVTYAYGDTRSLICSIPLNAALSVYVFFNLFNGCTSLMTAPELPAMSLAQNCYRYMFNGCSSLVTAPKLPAMSLAQNCYSYMFYNCTSLVNAPELPAMTLAASCYRLMFYGCTSLITAPELPAMSLEQYCYMSMFGGCTSLNEVTMLATDISANNCLNDWLSNVSAIGDFYCPSELTIPTGSSGIPSGWTRHDI